MLQVRFSTLTVSMLVWHIRDCTLPWEHRWPTTCVLRRLHHLLAAQKGVSTCLGLPGSTAEEAEGLAMKAALENSFLEVDGEILSRARQEDPQGRDGACAVVAVRVGGGSVGLPPGRLFARMCLSGPARHRVDRAGCSVQECCLANAMVNKGMAFLVRCISNGWRSS